MAKFKPGNWATNFGHSVKFSAVEMVEDINPALRDLVNTNKDFVSNVTDTIKDLRKGQFQIRRMLRASAIGKGLSKAADRLWTGDIYGESENDNDSTGLGFDDMELGGDSDYGFSAEDLDLSNLPSPEEVAAGIGKKNISQAEQTTIDVGAGEIDAINSGTKANVAIGKENLKATVAVGNAIQSQTVALSKALDRNTNTNLSIGLNQIAMDQSIHRDLTNHLATINQNAASIVAFQNDTMAKFTSGSMKYYEDSLTELRKMSALLERMAPPEKNDKRYESQYERAFSGNGGAFSLEGYWEVLKENLRDVPIIGEYMDNPEMMASMIADAPRTFLTEFLKDRIPTLIKTSLGEMNRTIKEFIPALFDKLGSLGRDFEQQGWFKEIAKIFGIDAPSDSKNFAKYEKGAVPFDGITHRTINLVIPTYLSKILAAITGTEARMYAHDEGKWKTETDIKNKVEWNRQSDEDAALGSAYTIKNKIFDSIDNFDFITGTDAERSIEENRKTAAEYKKRVNKFITDIAKSGKWFDVTKDESYRDILGAQALMGDSDTDNFINFIKNQIWLLPKYQQMQIAKLSQAYKVERNKRFTQQGIVGDFSEEIEHGGFGSKEEKNAKQAAEDKEWKELKEKVDELNNERLSQGRTNRISVDEYKLGVYPITDKLDELLNLTKIHSDRVIGRLDSLLNVFGGNSTPPPPNPPTESNLSSNADAQNPTDNSTQSASSSSQSTTAETEAERAAREARDREIEEYFENKQIFENNMFASEAAKMARIIEEERNKPSKNEDDLPEKTEEEKEEEERIKRETEGITDKISRYMKEPTKILSDAIHGVDNTLYRILFGEDENSEYDSALEATIAGIKETFDRTWKWLDEQVYSPIKRFLFGDDFTESKVFKWMKGLFTIGKKHTRWYKIKLTKTV